MTQREAELRGYGVHNAKAMLVETKKHNDKIANGTDSDAIKLNKDLGEAIRMLTSIEYDLDQITDKPEVAPKRKASKA